MCNKLYIKYLCSFASFGVYSIKILLIFLSIPAISFSQNYISNGSVEEIKKCPYSLGDLQKALNFYWLLPTPDLYNECVKYSANNSLKVGIPDNILGHQYARTGKSYIGYITTPFDTIHKFIGESFYTALNDSLISEKKYKYRFYAVLADSSDFNTNAVESFLSPDSNALYWAPYPFPPNNAIFTRYYVQVDSFSVQPTKKYLLKLERLGLRYKVKYSDKYKVLIGAYGQKNDARKALVKVRKHINSGAFIVKL